MTVRQWTLEHEQIFDLTVIPFPRKTAFGVVFVLALLAILAWANVGSQSLLWINLYWLAGAGGALWISLMGMPQRNASGWPVRAALSVGLAAYLAGQIVWALQVLFDWAVVPGPSDAFFLLAPLATIWGALAVFRDESIATVNTARLDAATVMLAIITVTLVVFGDSAWALGGAEGASALLYPILYLSPAGAFLIGVLSLAHKPRMADIWLVLLGAAILGASFTLWTHTALTGTPRVAAPVDFMFGIGLLLVGCGAATWRSERATSDRQRRVLQTLSEIVPVGSVVIAIAVVLGLNPGGDHAVLVWAAALGTLIINGVRQVLRIQTQQKNRRALQQEIDRREVAEYNYKAAFHQGSVPLALIRFRDGHIVDANDAFARLVGRTRDDLKKRTEPAIELIWKDPDQRQIAWDHLRDRATISDGVVDFETFEGAQKHCHYSTAIVRHGGSSVWQIALSDQSAVRASEQAQSRLQSHLQHFETMNVIGTLSSSIAHDFRNLSSVIVGYSSLAAARDDVPEEVRGFLTEIETAGVRSEELVTQLMTFSRRDEEKNRTVDLVLVIRETARFLESTLPRKFVVTVDTDLESAIATGNTTHAQQVLLNLGTNAVQAMPLGGELRFELMKLELEKGLVSRNGELAPGSYYLLQVADTGTGMDSATLTQVFEPFFTTKPVGSGTGLGLSSVRETVTALGGTVDLESTPGRGTRFDLYWPAATTGNQPDRLPDQPISLGEGQRILIVDDNKAIAMLHSHILESAGYQTTTRFDGPQALATFSASPDKFDMLLTDHDLPGFDGSELNREVTSLRKDLPVLMVSGTSLEEINGPVSEDCFLLKPVAPLQLVRAVGRVIRGVGNHGRPRKRVERPQPAID